MSRSSSCRLKRAVNQQAKKKTISGKKTVRAISKTRLTLTECSRDGREIKSALGRRGK